MVALRFATVLRAFGRSGSGGGLKDDEGAGLAVVVAFDPVRPGGGECFVSRLLLGSAAADCGKGSGSDSPTEALVWPPLVSQGFGGDGVAISPDKLLSPTVLASGEVREGMERDGGMEGDERMGWE